MKALFLTHAELIQIENALTHRWDAIEDGTLRPTDRWQTELVMSSVIYKVREVLAEHEAEK